MKKKDNKKFSKKLLKIALTVLITTIVIILLAITISILSFGMNHQAPGKRYPFNSLIIILFGILGIVFLFMYYKSTKITSTLQKLEDATEKVAKGNFKIQLELTDDDDINSYLINFNKMVKELDGMETLKEDFISNVSHEFKTPLSVIQLYSKALRNPDLDQETKLKYQEVLDNNIKKLTNLTTNILSLSRLENQEIILDKSEYLLDEQIRQCILELEPNWSKKNIDFSLELPKTKFIGSKDLIAQIWQNIIGNAIKFSSDNGKISISIKNKNNDIVVKISDNGIGMNQETLNKIFDKFYQGDTSHSKEGNGLGLALVNRILKICDGKINVESKENQGSTFEITFINNSTNEKH